MTWEKIYNQHSSLQEYRLTRNDGNLVLKYNPLHRSARVTFQNNYRLFFLESAGSMSGKIVFRNEYGMETGSIAHDRLKNDEGTIFIDNHNYRYKLHSESLTIYDKEQRHPLADIKIKLNSSNSSIRSFDNIDVACFAIGICWYLSIGLSSETLITYATAS